MSRKLTHEEYVKRVAEINPNIEVLGRYVNSQTKILHKCKIDEYEWYVRPSSILSGSGCPRCCGQEVYGHDEYIKRTFKINPDVEVLGTYINSSTKILHRCKIDGYKWMSTPNNILMGNGCPVCGGTMLKTHEQYVEELKLKNPSVVVVGRYVNHTTKITHKCLIHNYEWGTTPANALKGYNCPMCKKEEARCRLAKSHDDYVKEVSLINKNIEVLGEYINMKVKIKHKCLVCGCEWNTAPNSILHGHGCPRCARNETYGHDGYIKRISEINKDIEVLGEYVNSCTPILHKCKIDDCEWMATPNNILRGRGCPKCCESKGEKMVGKWLEKNNIEYIYQMSFDSCRDIKPLPFDFYLPDYNICIEYDGIQHFESVDFSGKGEKWAEQQFEYVQKHDKIKNEYCENNNIELLRIPYFKNIEEELLKLYKLTKVKGVVV